MQHDQRETSTPRFRFNGKISQYVWILVQLLIFADGLFINDPEPLVKTKWGLIRGKWSESLRGRPIANFLGIPYALPPVGDLRFRSPQRWNRTWTTIRNGTVDGQKCAQLDNNFNMLGSEDCLYLNVFVSMNLNNQQERAKLPVLVFVHGGAHVKGSSSSETYAPDYLMDHDIILVTLNYRLNVLGFFSTTNQASPGNYGLKDTLMALEWIRENIHSFKGNPESVTLMGSSAGSATVHILALSKKTEGLFDKYILHSGSALTPWALHPGRTYRRLCLEVARLLGCLPKEEEGAIALNETSVEYLERREERGDRCYNDISNRKKHYNVEDDEEMMKCMRTVDVTKIVKMIEHYTIWRHNPLCIFGPTLEEEDSEDAILTMHPMKVIKNGLFRDIPAIMQLVKDEGLVKTIDFFTDFKTENEMIENFEQYLPYLVEYNELISNTSIFAAAIQDFYFSGDVTLGITYNITEMTSDGLMTHGILQAVKYQSKMANSSIYFSYFTYEGTFTSTFSSGISTHYGIAHGDDINYLFPVLNNKHRNQLLHNTENDITMINIMTEMWANFVKEGIPRAWMIPAWPNYRDHHELMRFGIGKSPDIVVQADFLSGRTEFWEKLMANVSVESVECDASVGDSTAEMLSGNADTINRLTIHIKLLIIPLIVTALFRT